MRVFDENLREIFLYEYGEGDFESAWSVTLFSYREISDEEIAEAQVAFERAQKEFAEHVEVAKEKSGLNRAQALRSTKDRLPEDEFKACYDCYREEYGKGTKYPLRYEFIKEKLGLETLEIERSI